MSGCSSGVEHNLAKVGVERSNRFTRSILPKTLQVHQRIARIRHVLSQAPCRQQVTPQPALAFFTPSRTRNPFPGAALRRAGERRSGSWGD
jgi:hypothetical protein